MRCYLFDLDGTLADYSHRLHHIEKSPKDWRAFFAACADDAPIPHMIQLARDLDSSEFCLVYVSGRSDECRGATEGWLRLHDLPHGKLYMRKAGDYRNDDILKPELLQQVLADGYKPIMAFDDRARCPGVACSRHSLRPGSPRRLLMFGRRKRKKSPDFSGCPSCGRPLIAQSGLVRCSSCGSLNAGLWGTRNDKIYACDRYGQGGEKRMSVRYDKDEDNPGSIPDRPGKLVRELDK